MFQNIAMYFTNVWDATVAFFVSNGPMACLAVVAAAIVGVVVVLYISHLERMKEMIDPDDLDEQGQQLWDEHKANSVNPIELGDDEYESWMAGEARHCHENSLPFPVSGEAMLQDLEAMLSEDERLESSAYRWQESQSEQDYWQRRAAEGYIDCSPTCNCPECVGVEP